MRDGQAFIGFNEGRIDFPPTFKYDVQRSNKRHKLRSIRLSRTSGTLDTSHEKMLTEIEEKEREEQEDEEEDDPDGGEAASIASTAWTSIASRYTGAGGDISDEKEPYHEADEYFSYTNASTAAATRANMHPGSAMHKVWAAAAAHKAKAKFVALINSSAASGSPGKLSKFRKKSDVTYEDAVQSMATSPTFQATTFPPTPGQSAPGSPSMEDDKYLKPSRSLASSAGELAKVVGRSGSPRKSEEEENDDGEKGVYDTSHKRRVPSW